MSRIHLNGGPLAGTMIYGALGHPSSITFLQEPAELTETRAEMTGEDIVGPLVCDYLQAEFVVATDTYEYVWKGLL